MFWLVMIAIDLSAALVYGVLFAWGGAVGCGAERRRMFRRQAGRLLALGSVAIAQAQVRGVLPPHDNLLRIALAAVAVAGLVFVWRFRPADLR